MQIHHFRLANLASFSVVQFPELLTVYYNIQKWRQFLIYGHSPANSVLKPMAFLLNAYSAYHSRLP